MPFQTLNHSGGCSIDSAIQRDARHEAECFVEVLEL